MTEVDLSKAALVLVGHGSSESAEASVPVRLHAAELRRRRLFAQVEESFWKQEPGVPTVLEGLSREWVFIVPLLMSEGYFSEEVIPSALGFPPAFAGGGPRLLRRGTQSLVYSKPVGTHDSMRRVVLDRAEEVVRLHPFPCAPKAQETTLFLVGHGTEQSENSRKAIERHAQYLRNLNQYAAVQAVFLEEEPRLSECYRLSQTQAIVVVPFFISDGPHVQEDIPVLLGNPAERVRQRFNSGQPTWRNPTEKHGKLVWYSSSVGTDPWVAEVILDRVRECVSWFAH